MVCLGLLVCNVFDAKIGINSLQVHESPLLKNKYTFKVGILSNYNDFR